MGHYCSRMSTSGGVHDDMFKAKPDVALAFVEWSKRGSGHVCRWQTPNMQTRSDTSSSTFWGQSVSPSRSSKSAKKALGGESARESKWSEEPSGGKKWPTNRDEMPVIMCNHRLR